MGLLSLAIWTPVAFGIVLLALGRDDQAKTVRWVALIGALVSFLVTLPLISQAIASAWLLTFTLSLDDVVISAFLNGPGSTTMPITIFSRARLGLSPSVNTVATLTVAVVSLGVFAASIWMSRAEKRRALEMAAAYRKVD